MTLRSACRRLNFGRLGHGLSEVSPLLATAIPLGIYNFTEGMSNVESASAAGDSYNLRSVLLADGTGAVVGSMLGSPFPPAVYIGHPGWKAAGGRTSYSMGSGIVIALLCFFGMFSLLGAVLPLPAIVPILLYIGLLIGAQAFQAIPKRHAIAVVIAIIPNIASWAQGQMDDVLAAAGTTAQKVGYDNIAANGAIYKGTALLGGGAVLAGLMLGAITAFLVDRKFWWAAGYSSGRGGAGVHRAHPRHEGGLEHRRPDRARLPFRRGDLRGRRAGGPAQPEPGARGATRHGRGCADRAARTSGPPRRCRSPPRP